MFVGASQQVKNRGANPNASSRYTASLTERMGFVGNSFTQNYLGDQGVAGGVERVLDGEQPSHTTDLNVIPAGPNTIGDSSGWFFGQTLSMMCFNGSGINTDALDHLVTEGVGTYDSLVFTSGYRQDVNNALREDIGLGTGNQFTAFKLYKRQLITDLDALGYTGPVIIRMTQEGINANSDTDYSDYTRQIRVIVNAAKQLEQEALALTLYNVPDTYVWYRLTVGNADGITPGTAPFTPVPTAAAFTHPASTQPGNLNVAWLQRSQNQTTPPNTNNSHQSLLGAIVNVCTWCYSIYGIDPADSMTYFELPWTMPQADSSATERNISTDGLRIYGGHNAASSGAGNQGLDPYNNAGNNPGGDPTYGAGPYDTDLDFDWTAAFRTEITDRIRSAVDDFYAGTTGLEL